MSSQNQVYDLILSGTQSLNTELSSLAPSTQVFLYEIDLTNIYPGTSADQFPNGSQPIYQGVFRFHNNYNLYNNLANPYGQIKWQDNYYFPFPVNVEGFEISSAGTLPTPTFSISNLSPDYSNNSFYRYIRMQIQSLGDIVGAKFTRIKTFLKYLDGSNFSQGYNPFNNNTGIYEVELPRDIFYIDRKTAENKNIIQYQLNSILDVENATLPARTIFSTKCPFQYRGEGCCYEYDSRLTYIHSGVYANTVNPSYQIKGLQTAPPVATQNDQLFIGQSGIAIFHTGNSANRNAILRITGGLGNSGAWQLNANYQSGDFTFLQNNGLKFYFVCINNHLSDPFSVPPNTNYWTSDSCSKSISSCRLRWLKNPAFRPVIWPENRNGENFAKTFKRFEDLLGATNYRSNQNYVLTGIDGVPVYFPRRPGAENPISEQAHGIPKDANGNYLNGFLPFGGFPGTNQPQP
jgi:lambda family phage minor tail protein L